MLKETATVKTRAPFRLTFRGRPLLIFGGVCLGTWAILRIVLGLSFAGRSGVTVLGGPCARRDVDRGGLRPERS